MYTAKEAREKAEKSISDETKKQLEYAEKCIEFAVGKGEMSCCFGKCLGKQAIGKLEGLGYMVKDRSNQRDGVEYEISWKEAQNESSTGDGDAGELPGLSPA